MRPLLALLLLTLPLPADSIVSGGSLLNQANADQLASWLGQGDLTFTNVFSQTPTAGGSTAFHTAVNGIGPTFSIFQTSLGLAGGYNPLSWNSTGAYNTDPTDSGRTAFIFDLSTGALLRQRLGDSLGQYQAFNLNGYGPAFGGGHDLVVNSSDLSSGYAYGFSYGGGFGQPNVFGGVSTTGNVTSFTVSRVEAFTFAQAPVQTPEPGMLSLCGGSLLLLAALRERYQEAIR